MLKDTSTTIVMKVALKDDMHRREIISKYHYHKDVQKGILKCFILISKYMSLEIKLQCVCFMLCIILV